MDLLSNDSLLRISELEQNIMYTKTCFVESASTELSKNNSIYVRMQIRDKDGIVVSGIKFVDDIQQAAAAIGVMSGRVCKATFTFEKSNSGRFLSVVQAEPGDYKETPEDFMGVVKNKTALEAELRELLNEASQGRLERLIAPLTSVNAVDVISRKRFVKYGNKVGAPLEFLCRFSKVAYELLGKGPELHTLVAAKVLAVYLELVNYSELDDAVDLVECISKGSRILSMYKSEAESKVEKAELNLLMTDLLNILMAHLTEVSEAKTRLCKMSLNVDRLVLEDMHIVDLLEGLPKGVKADYNGIKMTKTSYFGQEEIK